MLSDNIQYKNKYDFSNDIVIGYTNNTNIKYIFDKKYFFEVAKHSWNYSRCGLISSHINNNQISLGRFIYELENGPIEYGKLKYINGDSGDCRYSNLYISDNRNKYIFEGDIAIGTLYNDNHTFIIDKNMYKYAKEYIFGLPRSSDGNTYNIITRTNKYYYSLFYLVLKWNGIDPGNSKLYAINGDKYDARLCNIGILKNEYNIVGDIAYGHIPNSDIVFIIDAAFVESINKYKCINDDRGYIIIYNNKKKIKLHRFICEIIGINIDGFVVHHINGNKHDNRLCNLYICTTEMHQKIHYYEMDIQSNIEEFINFKQRQIIQPFIFI